MTTRVAATEPLPEAAGARPDGRGRRAWARPALLRAVGWALALGLLGLNAWWLWRDARPVADLATVARWITEGRTAEAEPALREALRRSPNDGEARMLLGRLLAQRGDMPGCARELRAVPFWWPEKPKALFLEAQALKQIDRRPEAERPWRELTAMDPLHPMPDTYVSKAVLELMELYALEERWDDAQALIWRVYDRSEPADRPGLLIMRMRTELERVMPSRAAEKLRGFLRAVHDDWEALRALAHADAALGRHDEAKREILKCIDARPDDPRGWREYLTMLHDQGDQEGLTAALARLPAAAANDPEILKLRAAALEKQADWPGAADLLRRLVDARPFDAEALYRLATAEERLGRRDEARAHRDRSKAVRAARADLAPAFQNYLDATRTNPPDPAALAAAVNRLSSLCNALGWTRDAKAWAQLAPAPE